MKEILFELNPSIVSVFDAFSKSPFFSEDAYACRARYSIQSKLVVPKISEEVV
jgi:hypothetical protein